MKNIFYFTKSAATPQKQFLLNNEGFSPLSVGYGYCLTSTGSGSAKAYAIVPVSAELSIVDRIFRDFIANKSITGIVTKLNDEQVPTRQRRGWNYNSVSNILKNENYLGKFAFRKYEMITNGESLKYVPERKSLVLKETFSELAKISDDTWNKVQETRLNRNNRLGKQYSPTRKSKKRRVNRSVDPQRHVSRKKTESFPLIQMILNSLISFASFGLPKKMWEIFRLSANDQKVGI